MSGYRIKNWGEFQHYKDRNPPWIKLHFSILTSLDWVSLDDASRVLSIACMLVASRHEGFVPDDSKYIERIAYLNKKPNFEPLVKCGFLVKVGSPLDNPLSENREETETETETEQLANASISLSSASKVTTKFQAVIPESLATITGFVEAWEGYLESRKSKRQKATEKAKELILNRLATRPSDAVMGLNLAIERSWTGFDWDWVDKSNGRISKSGLPVPSNEELKAMGPKWGTNREE